MHFMNVVDALIPVLVSVFVNAPREQENHS